MTPAAFDFGKSVVLALMEERACKMLPADLSESDNWPKLAHEKLDVAGTFEAALAENFSSPNRLAVDAVDLGARRYSDSTRKPGLAALADRPETCRDKIALILKDGLQSVEASVHVFRQFSNPLHADIVRPHRQAQLSVPNHKVLI